MLHKSIEVFISVLHKMLHKGIKTVPLDKLCMNLIWLIGIPINWIKELQ